MTLEPVSKNTLSADLASIRSFRHEAREHVLSSYYQLEQSMQRGEEVASSVSSCLDHLNGSNHMLALPQEAISQLLSARKLLLTIDIVSGGEGTVARLETLLKLPTPDRALRLAADSLSTARTAGMVANVEEIIDTLTRWEASHDTGCIVPLTLSLDDWCNKLFTYIAPITPVPLLADTTKVLSLHIQALAQQVDRAFHVFTVSYNNIHHLSTIRSVDSNILLLDIYNHTIQHILNKIAPTLTSSINAILNSITLEQESSADYLQLIANLIARFISIVEHHDSRIQQLVCISIQSIITTYTTIHEHVCTVYRNLETNQTSSTLTAMLLDGELEHFETLAEYSFQRIRRLERVSKEFIHSLETNVVQQTLSRLATQHPSDFDLLTLYLLNTFVSNYAHDTQLKEKIARTYQAALNNFAATFITKVQSELLIIVQTQDASSFIESLCTMLESQEYNSNYTSEVASAVIKCSTLMLANMLIHNPIPLNQAQFLKHAFKEIAAALRNTLKIPATQICAPFLSLQSILTAATPEEGITLAKGTCFEAVAPILIQSYLSATSNKSSVSS